MTDRMAVGDRVERVMVVSKKIRRDFSGGKFLLFQFSDRDGVLKGVWWEPTREAETSIGINDVVRVGGEITDYQGSLQLKVAWLEKLEEGQYDPSIFLPTTPRDGGEIFAEIMDIVSSMENLDLRNLLEGVFGREGFREGFLRAPAAKGWHHAWVGGLADHVIDMARMAGRAAEIYPEVDRDLLMAGILLHDIGKMEELSVTNHINYSDRGRLLGHITLGSEMLECAIREIPDFPEELAIKLKHMILSHHGNLEHGSPVVPMTVEAMLLHYLDNLDAQVRGTLTMIEKNGGEGGWTEYVKLLDRFIYTGGKGSETGGGEG
ncbi:MAG TPA: HD domain-containing protein [Candidatus Eisenbacteria bacterium]|uniref:HD domain-containing protein n=1 Tax=Eiseniibacteriota bacterium TaxID=2212470 RepID=A0A7V2AVF0_UNCEI|nr:HD domain-containing protein [Candidatus Eisenbacteria bacterium]